MNFNKGIHLINKPIDWTSHDVVAFIRGKAKHSPDFKNIKKIKVGHSGTLDPFATGLLIVGVGREYTKKMDEFKKLPKIYEAVIKLGATSDTQDKTGEIKESDNINIPNKNTLKNTLKTFLGNQEQTPPMFSAKKVQGKKLYELARQGIEIERKPVKIELYKIKLLKYKYPFLNIRVKCSTGTYIRTLANDIGEKLQTGAYCEGLTRIRIGKYKLRKAEEIKK